MATPRISSWQRALAHMGEGEVWLAWIVRLRWVAIVAQILTVSVVARLFDAMWSVAILVGAADLDLEEVLGQRLAAGRVARGDVDQVEDHAPPTQQRDEDAGDDGVQQGRRGSDPEAGVGRPLGGGGLEGVDERVVVGVAVGGVLGQEARDDPGELGRNRRRQPVLPVPAAILPGLPG